METKQTSVEWLLDQVKFIDKEVYAELYNQSLEQAQQMHEEEIMDAYEDGEDNAMNYHSIPNFKDITAEQYYNQTYNK
jgi:hypothetical protein